MSSLDLNCNVSLYQFPRVSHRQSYVAWLVVASIAFASQEVFISLLDERRYFLARLIFTYTSLLLAPVAVIYLSQLFLKSARAIHPYIDVPSDASTFAIDQAKKIFSRRAPFVALSSVAVAALATAAALLTVGLPFQSIPVNVLVLSLGFIGGLVGGHGVYQSVCAIWFVTKWARHPLRDVFFYDTSDALSAITRSYSIYASLTLVAYALQVGGIWSSGHISAPPILTWLALTSFVPLVVLLWTLYCIHIFMSRLKSQNLRFVRAKLGAFGINTVDISTVDDLKRLSLIMVLQDHIGRMREWPFYVSAVATLFASVAVPFAQIAIRIVLS